MKRWNISPRWSVPEPVNGSIRRWTAVFPIVLAIVLLVCSGCEERTASEPMDSLKDPNMQPALLTSLPKNGGTGPFNGIGVDVHRAFQLQFTKLMDVNSFEDGRVAITGFDRPVRIVRWYAAAQYTDVIGFSVVDDDGREVPYSTGHQYTVTVSKNVWDIHGYHLPNDIQITFTPEPSFRIVSVAPVGTTDSPYFYPEIRFSGPVTSAIFPSLSIAPAVAGTWSLDPYDSTRTVFKPADKFGLATTYTVHVPSTVADRAGRTLGKDSSFSFLVNGVVTVDYSYTSTVNDKFSFICYFSDVMDTVSVRNALTLSPSTAGTVRFNGSRTMFTYAFGSAIMPNQSIDIAISGAAHSETGVALTPYTTSITTPKFIAQMYVPFSSFSVSRVTSVDLTLTYDIDTASARSAFSIEPAAAGTLTLSDRHIYFSPSAPLAPQTKYTVGLSTSLKTITGAPLLTPFTASFTTGN